MPATDIDEIYKKLLKIFEVRYPYNPREMLSYKISELMEEGKTRENAILTLYEREGKITLAEARELGEAVRKEKEEDIEKQIREHQKSVKKLTLLFSKGELTEESYKAAVKPLEEKIARLEREKKEDEIKELEEKLADLKGKKREEATLKPKRESVELPALPPTGPTKGLNLKIFRKKHLILLESFLVLFVFLTPYILSSGHLPAPFSFMEAKYSVNLNYQEPKLSIPSLTFVLTTENIVNSSYIEVTESVGTATPVKFYVNISDRSVFLSKELLPELPPHGEYYDLWIGEGHKAGDAVKILNSTTTLSNSGIKFHGWLFFNSLTTNKIPFNFSRTIEYQGTPIPVDYVGEIGITYDQETGLMIEDHQSWTANLTYPGLPQTISYEVAITYESSNVRFTYITYLLTIGIYTAPFIIIAFLLFVMIYMWRRGREEELPAPPPETPETPEAPTETPSEKPETPTTPET